MAVYPTESEFVNEWREATKLRTLRDTLLVLLGERFPGAIPSEVVKAINEQPSQDLLHQWFRRAVTIKTMDDFVAYLRQ